MSLASFLNIQPAVEYGSAKQPNQNEKRGLEEAKLRNNDSDRFKPSVRDSKGDKGIDKASDIDKSSDSRLYVQDEQGEFVEIPLSSRQLQHLANLDRVSLVDPEVLEKFGGLHAFVDALKSLLPGTPELSSDDLVSLPYQIEALSEEHFGSETFPHLIAANLSPAELNVLVKQLDGLQASTAIAQINQENLNKPTSVVFMSSHENLQEQANIKSVIEGILSGSEKALSGEVISAAQLLIGSETVGFSKWFQRPNVAENSVGLREWMGNQVEAVGYGNDMSPFPNAVKRNYMFGKIVSHFAQENVGGSMAKGVINAQEFGQGFNSSIITPLVDAVSPVLDLDEHLHSVSSLPTTNASLQSLHAHGVLGSQKAGQAHQATQLVATNIQKAVDNGGNQKLSVLLDPPELGKVQIDVEVDASNKLKVRVVTEREAAYMLLQRDYNALEQSLQNTGLDVDSGDIELSFAGSDFFFGHEDQQAYADFGLPANKVDGEEQNIEDDAIETQVDVFRDPYTGMWHYNIVV